LVTATRTSGPTLTGNPSRLNVGTHRVRSSGNGQKADVRTDAAAIQANNTWE
jgi:hypothetical protein